MPETSVKEPAPKPKDEMPHELNLFLLQKVVFLPLEEGVRLRRTEGVILPTWTELRKCKQQITSGLQIRTSDER